MSNMLKRSPRKHVEGTVHVINAMTGSPIGRIGNISASGMLLLSRAAIPVNSLFQFQFHIPNAQGVPVEIEVGMHEEWGEAAGVPGQHWVGFRIIDISKDHKKLLLDWIGADER